MKERSKKTTVRKEGAKDRVAGGARRPTVVGIDIGDKYLQVCEIDADDVVTGGRFVSTESKLREQFEGRERRRIIVEMGSSTRWIAELLRSLGHEVLIVDPRRIKLISGSLYKDDKVDALTLALLGTEAPRLLKTVPLRDLEHQKALTLVRARACAVTGRTRVINSLRGMLKPYGYRIPKSATSTLVSWLNETLDAEILPLIQPLLGLLETSDIQIGRYDKEAKQLLPKLAPEAVRLCEIPGVGPITALYFAALIGNPERFRKARDVGSYLGLCRRRDDSGEHRSELRITKAGDRYMRALLVNCAAQIMGPFGKESDLRTWGLKKMGGGTRVEKRKAKVALARKLSVIMLTLWKSGASYDRFHQTKNVARAA
jgi:transposase